MVAHGKFRDARDGVVEPRRERGAGVWALRVEVDQLETHRRAPLASKHRERGLHQQPMPVNLPLEEVGLAERLRRPGYNSPRFPRPPISIPAAVLLVTVRVLSPQPRGRRGGHHRVGDGARGSSQLKRARRGGRLGGRRREVNHRRRATHPTLVLVLVLVGSSESSAVLGTLGTLPDVQTPQPSLDGEGVVQQLRLERGLRLERIRSGAALRRTYGRGGGRRVRPDGAPCVVRRPR